MKKIIIIDGFNILYRMFFAVPPFALVDGTPVNAVYGVAKLLSTIVTTDRPDAVFFVLDGPGKKSRSAYFADYKATRDRMPDQLRIQEPLLYELLDVLGLKPFVFDGTEADDIIGTLVTRLTQNSENDIYIYSGDKDLYQFAGPHVAIVDTMKKMIARRDETIEKFGVEPSQVVDYLAIVGDASDNIPGINGFGPKKAVALLSKYGTLQSIYAHLDEIPDKMREILLFEKDNAFLSQKLATILCDIPVDVSDLARFQLHADHFRTPKAIDFFRRCRFDSLLSKEHLQNNSFADLDIHTRSISPEEALQFLVSLKDEQVFFCTTSGSDKDLEGISLSLDGKHILDVDCTPPHVYSFLQTLLDTRSQMVGFDIKTDLRRMAFFLGKEVQEEKTEQGSLF